MTESIRFHDRVEVRLSPEGIAEVCLARPDKMNALDDAMFSGIIAAGDHLATLRGLRVVVLHGEGRAFCAGLDMASFGRMAEGGADAVGMPDIAARTHGLANRAQQVGWQWRTLPVPVIAAVHGVAFGGGLQVALGADFRYIAPDARMSVMEIKWGLVPDMSGMALLRDLLRGDIARELVYTGRIVGAEEACRIGLATALADDPLAQARAVAAAIAQASPDAVRGAKRLLNQWPDADAAAILLAESVEQAAIIGGANQREAVRAQQEKRPPRFVDPA